MRDIQVTWNPIVDDETASHLIAESDGGSFVVTVKHEAGAVEHVESQHDGLVHFVSVDVPLTARVEVSNG
jgi:hypothetical protein